MTDELEWTFPSVPKCEEKGLNDSGVEMFRGDTIVSLAREICQNSLDAAIRPADGTEPGPVEIEFSLFDLQASDFPAFDEFKDAMARSRDYWKENDQAVRFFDEMEPDLNAKVLHCLRISDANTTGLTGVHAPDSSSGSAWHSLVMSSGVSNKSRGITGGSFGIGKFAAFSCSRFRTVFYATKTADGKEGFQGVCRLVTFRDEQNNMTLGTSYVGARDMKPLARWWSPDTAYERTRPGTDIFIPAFVGGDGFRKDIVKSVLDGFLYAIWEKKLVVTIRDGTEPLIINKAWLIKAERTGDELFADARALFNALRQHESKWKVKSFGDLGEVRLSLINGKELDKRIAMIREPGMLIFKKDHFRSFVSFTGVLLVKGELNRILRDFENPQHNKWEEKRAPDNARYLEAIYTFCRDAVNDIVKDDLGEELDSGLGDILPDSGDDGEPRTEETLDVKIKGDVTVLSPKRRKRRKGKSAKGGTPTGKDPGSDTHNGPKPSPTKKDNGTGGAAKVARKEIGRVSFRQVCLDRPSGLYKLKIVPAKDAAKGVVDVIAVAEIKEYPAPVKSARLADGTPLTVNGNEIGGIPFKKNEPAEILVSLDYHDYLSLEVECFE